jgi:hypothetical protein
MCIYMELNEMRTMLGDIECFKITDVVYYSINDIDIVSLRLISNRNDIVAFNA